MSELATLRAWIADLRDLVERRTSGLDAEQLARRSVLPSSLSLLGLVRHLAQMEHYWFQIVLQHADETNLFVVDGDWDAQFDGAVADPLVVQEAFDVWRRVMADTDAWLDALEPDALDTVIDPADRIATVRDVLLQVLREYAQHAGHLDLLRECVDGQTG